MFSFLGRPKGTAALVSASATALVASMSSAYAQEQQRQFDIPAQTLSSALIEFARQSDVMVVADPTVVNSRRAPAVHGSFTPSEALNRLLAGSGLTAQQRSGGGFTLADTSSPTRLGDARDRASPSEALIEEEEIVVVGTNIRGVYPASSPVDIYTAEDIARTGATTTEQFIQKLPQNFGTRTPFTPTAINGGTTESVSGVDLRGLGVGTSLTLLNGRRLGLADQGRTADVSLIPAGAIERVEVLTDGASAIYGSDAVGGVVNFVLRDDFEGAETRVSYGGVSRGGLRQGDLSQTFGRAWGSGHGIVSYSAYSASALEVVERDYAFAADRGMLTPVDQRQTLLASFSQDITNQLNISGDLAYSLRDVKYARTNTVASTNPLNWTLSTDSNETQNAFANLAVDYDLTADLHASFRATYGESNTDSLRHTINYNQTPPVFTSSGAPRRVDTDYSGLDLTAQVDGSLFSLPAGDARFSVGAGVLDENLDSRTPTANLNFARATSYAFGEFFVPIVSPDQNVPLVRRLEVNLAGRYTSYEDQSEPRLNQEFGNNADPKIGLLWSPIDALNLRGTYGTSFRAPSLIQLDESSGSILVQSNFPVPFPSGTPSTRIFMTGRPVDELRPETATTYTLGFDFQPNAHPSLRVSATYYRISYEDRIATPAQALFQFQNPQLFPSLIYQPSSAAEIEAQIRASASLQSFDPTVNLSDPAAAAQLLFSRMPNVYFFDYRSTNLSRSDQDGFDLSVSNSFSTSWGDMRYGVDLTRIASYYQQTTETSPRTTVVDTAAHPADLRVRTYVGVSRGGFDGTFNVNYVDDYANSLTSTAGATEIDSWITADLALSYDFGEARSGSFDGVRLSLGVQNLFDEDPPRVTGRAVDGVALPVGFDPANANPLGRLVVLGLAKTW